MYRCVDMHCFPASSLSWTSTIIDSADSQVTYMFFFCFFCSILSMPITDWKNIFYVMRQGRESVGTLFSLSIVGMLCRVCSYCGICIVLILSPHPVILNLSFWVWLVQFFFFYYYLSKILQTLNIIFIKICNVQLSLPFTVHTANKVLAFKTFWPMLGLCQSKMLFNLGRTSTLEAILVIFGRSYSLKFFFFWKLLEKYEKWHHFCAHAQWWSPWRRKNVEKGHLASSNLTFLFIVIDRNGFRRMKEEGQIYKLCLRFF